MNALSLAVALALALWAAGRGRAQAEPSDVAPISTDRPGNANAATTVPKGRAQIESSLGFARDRAEGTTNRALSFPTSLRVGVLDRLELRASTSIVGVELDSASRAPKPTDTSVGSKLHVLRGGAGRPDVSVMVDVFLASGRAAFTAGATTPEARVSAAWALPQGIGFLWNVGGDVPRTDRRYARALYVTNLNYAPPILNGALTLFIESYGRLPLASPELPIVQIDVGAALLLGPDLQLDFFTQHGVTQAAPDFQASFGLSARI